MHGGGGGGGDVGSGAGGESGDGGGGGGDVGSGVGGESGDVEVVEVEVKVVLYNFYNIFANNL